MLASSTSFGMVVGFVWFYAGLCGLVVCLLLLVVCYGLFVVLIVLYSLFFNLWFVYLLWVVR